MNIYTLILGLSILLLCLGCTSSFSECERSCHRLYNCNVDGGFDGGFHCWDDGVKHYFDLENKTKTLEIGPYCFDKCSNALK